jgi:uncharacterized RDD family membrane protein YckC
LTNIHTIKQMLKDNSLPEGEIPSGAGVRFFASFLDALIIIISVTVVFKIFSGEHSMEWTSSIYWPTFYTIYLTITPVIWSGYIIGKRIFKIKVKRIDGGKLTLKNMIFREIIGNYVLGTITFGISVVINIIMILFRKDKRGIHDIIGGTYVAGA